MSLTYEQATTVAKSLLSAVTVIEEERAKLAIVRQEAATAVNAANEANARLGDVNKSLRDVEQQLVVKRDELAKVQVAYAETYEKRKSEEGRINAIRSEVISLQQKLGA